MSESRAERITVETDAGPMPAHRWLPEGGTGPGIALMQEIFGVSDYVRRRAQDLADAGYVVLVPEIFWRLGESEPFQGDDALERGMATAQRLDWDAAVRDGAAAVRALRADPAVTGDRVGLVGFCFGGGLAFNVAAVEPVEALVSYYGSALPGLLDLAPQVTCASLHHFGLADSFIDVETVRQIETAVTAQPATTFHTYDGADHAFDNDDAAWFHPEASSLAWARTLEFLKATLVE
ncbi:carboxymethylenebutenolidase [Barrientosiimonas humi]|uniref:Carboxymethylenebutenolidase n=1 Tax=Barrientosiimonas humi TaxID=999931 RepID=A0A542XFT5_9MICO|nr:dienelactone hydrolase family protein [Barrientosiimonas humi]TQL34686.1 carboxymethylenebutenolidase [Barrientosiimonas humi]CAG7574676.1 Carboxymethylenebutenolidase [Barrientosiimonas humi]